MKNSRILQKIRELIQTEIRHVNTCYPCQVVEVEGSRARVKILVGDTKNFDFPEVIDVPIISLKAGNTLINLPTKAGDKGVLFVSSKSTRQFKKGQSRYYKADFDIDNSFYLGGVFADGESSDGQSNENIVIKNADTKIEMSETKVTVTSTDVEVNSTNAVVNSDSVEATTKEATINSEIAEVNGTVSATVTSPLITLDSRGVGKVVITPAGTVIDSKNFLTHVHSGVTSGPNNTGGVV